MKFRSDHVTNSPIATIQILVLTTSLVSSYEHLIMCHLIVASCVHIYHMMVQQTRMTRRKRNTNLAAVPCAWAARQQ